MMGIKIQSVLILNLSERKGKKELIWPRRKPKNRKKR
jgi:hypothetical protein